MIFISQRKLQTIPQVSNRIYIQKKGAVKKSATKPVDFLDMEAHGL